MIKPTPWDEVVFGMPTWELTEYSKESIQYAAGFSGHQTIKVDPLANKKLLNDHGFYYCDTLIVPSCKASRLRAVHHDEASISRVIDIEHALKIFHGSFQHGRFHRDFNLPIDAADQRYDNWLRQLVKSKQVYGLYLQNVLAGFIGYNQNNLVLHAIAEEYRGKGLSKYWWSQVCLDLFQSGYEEIVSSISATNLAVLNLYASLGFSFKCAQDIYHRILR